MLGQNGIIEKSKEAVEKYKKAEEDEEKKLYNLEALIEGKNVEEISNKEEFIEFRKRVNSGENFDNTVIKLKCDIDLSSEENWTPIGTKNQPFKGVFDGNGHKIKNLKLGAQNEEYEYNYSEEVKKRCIGLFGFNEGIINNIGVESTEISESCSNGYVIGLIVGYNTGSIDLCWNITNISNIKSDSLGGIVGWMNSNGNVSRCFNEGNFEMEKEGSYRCLMAGIVGACLGGSQVAIEQCYNIGNMTGYQREETNVIVAGICSNNPAKVDSCYNKGIITLENTSGSNHYYPSSAGIVGQSAESELRLTNCYNVGEIILNTTDDASWVRKGSLVGLLGENYSLENNYCYINEELNAVGIGYDISSSPDENTITTYEDKDDLKNIANKLGKNFKEDKNNINGGFPILSWQ